MHNKPSQMEPLLPSGAPDREDLAREVVSRSAALGGQLHPVDNVSRGLARHREDYMVALSWADAPRRNDYDGRGNLSNEALVEFCRFFLTTCLDQIAFMRGLLKLDTLLGRINGYVSMRGAKLIPGPKPEYQSHTAGSITGRGAAGVGYPKRGGKA